MKRSFNWVPRIDKRYATVLDKIDMKLSCNDKYEVTELVWLGHAWFSYFKWRGRERRCY
jgi:hypothetical protein